VRLTKICRLLRRRQIPVSYMTLYRYAVEELGFGRRPATIPVADCGPGEEVQLDTGWVGWLKVDLFGRRKRFRAWIFTAARSRHRFVYPVLAETTASAIEACEAAWEFFGGVFKVVIPDNTKAIVNEADPLEPKLVLDFLECAQSRGFHVDPTRVRAPRDKARVERSVQTVRDDGYGGEEPRSIEEARVLGRAWCFEEYGLRRHSTTQRLPREHFEAEERPALLPAPSEPYEVPLWSDPKVGLDQHAQVAKALYSLPRVFRGRKLRARADTHTVRFYDGTKLVKTHPRVGPARRTRIRPTSRPRRRPARGATEPSSSARPLSTVSTWVASPSGCSKVLSRGRGCGRSSRCSAWCAATVPRASRRPASSRSKPTWSTCIAFVGSSTSPRSPHSSRLPNASSRSPATCVPPSSTASRSNRSYVPRKENPLEP